MAFHSYLRELWYFTNLKLVVMWGMISLTNHGSRVRSQWGRVFFFCPDTRRPPQQKLSWWTQLQYHYGLWMFMTLVTIGRWGFMTLIALQHLIAIGFIGFTNQLTSLGEPSHCSFVKLNKGGSSHRLRQLGAQIASCNFSCFSETLSLSCEFTGEFWSTINSGEFTGLKGIDGVFMGCYRV